MTKHLSQIELVQAITKEVGRQLGKNTGACPRQFNAIIKAANLVCEEFGKPFVESRPGTGIYAWLASDDRGMSSEFMASRILAGSGRCPEQLRGVRYAHPHDADDFGRCYRMLAALPAEEYENILFVASASPQWSALVKRWEELSLMHEAGDRADLSREIRRILSSADAGR